MPLEHWMPDGLLVTLPFPAMETERVDTTGEGIVTEAGSDFEVFPAASLATAVRM